MIARYLQASFTVLAILWMMAAPVAAQYSSTDVNDDLTAAERRALSQSALESHRSTAAGHGPEVDLRIVFPSEQTGLDNIMMTMLEPRDAGAHKCEAIAVKNGGNVISASFIPKKDVRPAHSYDVVVSDSMGDLFLVGRVRVGTASQQSYIVHAPLLTPGSPRYTPPQITSSNPVPQPPAQSKGTTRFAQAIQDQAVLVPSLGLRGTTFTPELLALSGASTRSFHGVIVAGVDSGSFAERAGLRGGDVIVAIDGRPCGSVQQLIAVTQDPQAPATAIDITFLRSNGHGGATPLHAKVPSARLVSLVSLAKASAKRVPALGLTGLTLTPQFFAESGDKHRPFNGVGVLTTQQGSLAQRAGLTAGDAITAVDGQPCASVEQLIGLLQRYESRQPIDLTVVRSNESGALDTRNVAVVLAPAPTVGYVPPSTGPGYVRPSTGPGYVAPSTGQGYVPPSTGPGYMPPSTGPGYVAPSVGPGYIPPGTRATTAPALPTNPPSTPAPTTNPPPTATPPIAPALPPTPQATPAPIVPPPTTPAPATPTPPTTSATGSRNGPGTTTPPTIGPGYIPPGTVGVTAPTVPASPPPMPTPRPSLQATPAPPTRTPVGGSPNGSAVNVVQPPNTTTVPVYSSPSPTPQATTPTPGPAATATPSRPPMFMADPITIIVNTGPNGFGFGLTGNDRVFSLMLQPIGVKSHLCHPAPTCMTVPLSFSDNSPVTYWAYVPASVELQVGTTYDLILRREDQTGGSYLLGHITVSTDRKLYVVVAQRLQ